MFFGIIVRMYKESGGKHNLPHIHAEYSGEEVVVALDGTILEGSIPKAKMKLLDAWMEIPARNWKRTGNCCQTENNFSGLTRCVEVAHMLQPKLVSVSTAEPLTLRLVYETGEAKLFDVSPYADGSWYGELRNPDYFRTVHLVDGGTGIEWEHGQDIAPHELYELSRSD